MARIKNLFGVADVTGVNDDNMLQIKTSTGRTNDKIKSINNYGFVSRPLPGSKCYLLFSGGVMSRGISFCVEDDRHKINLKDGEVAILDDKGNIIHLTEKGIKVTANQIIINGDTTVNGNLKVNGNISDSMRSMSEDRKIYNGHQHNIPNGISQKPNQFQ